MEIRVLSDCQPSISAGALYLVGGWSDDVWDAVRRRRGEARCLLSKMPLVMIARRAAQRKYLPRRAAHGKYPRRWLCV